jgi:hypothetical protein
MISLYCIPGRLMANLGYLFPGKGELWASRRRKDNRFVHFIYSSAFYAVCLYFWAASQR